MIDYTNDGEYYWEDAEGEALDPQTLPVIPKGVEFVSEGVSATYVTPGGEWWRPLDYWPQVPWPSETTYRLSVYKTQSTCNYCDGIHSSIKCHRIKAIEFYEDGTVKKVEFKD